MAKRGVYIRRDIEVRKGFVQQRVNEAEALERHTSRKVAAACDRFFKERNITNEYDWHTRERGPRPEH